MGKAGGVGGTPPFLFPLAGQQVLPGYTMLLLSEYEGGLCSLGTLNHTLEKCLEPWLAQNRCLMYAHPFGT